MTVTLVNTLFTTGKLRSFAYLKRSQNSLNGESSGTNPQYLTQSGFAAGTVKPVNERFTAGKLRSFA
jgi:hypothetical protein